MRRHYTGEQRSALIELVSAGGSTVSEAATRLGVNASTAYQWMKQAGEGVGRSGAEQREASRRRRQVARPTFVQLVRTGDLDATLVVRVGDAEVAVRRGFDADLLRAVVGALRGGTA